MRHARFAFVAVVLFAAASAQAQTVFKCKDAKGQVSFQQQPCDGERNGAIDVQPSNVVDGKPEGEAGTRAEAVRRAEVRSAQARGELSAAMTYSEAMQTLRGPGAPVSMGGPTAAPLRPSRYTALQPCYSEREIRNASMDASSVTKSEEQRRAARIRERVMRACLR